MKKSDTIIKTIRFHSKQMEIFNDYNKYRFQVVKFGRRAGKTTCVSFIACLKMLSTDNFRVGFCVPTYDKLSPVWILINATLKTVIKSANQSLKLITLVNGATIEFLSLDSEGKGRSRDFDLLILDEFAMVDGAEQKWEYNLSSTLIDRKGHAIFVSTPMGMDNFFSKLYYKALNGDDLDYKAYTCSTFDNPLLPIEELERMKRLPDDVYRQEVLGEVIQGQGSVFGDLKNILIKKSDITDDNINIYGVDLASRIDNTAIIGLNKGNQVVYCNVFRDTWPNVRRKIENICGHTIPIYFDSTGVGNATSDEFDEMKLNNATPFILTHQSKQDLIQTLSIAIKNGLVKIPIDYEQLISELNTFDYTLRDGKIFYQASKNCHDDLVIALGLAFYHNSVQTIRSRDFIYSKSQIQF